MSKKISFKGQILEGQQEKINLKTMNGKTGYQIVQFQIIGSQPGQDNVENICQVFTTDQTGSITADVNFTNSELIAVAYNKDFATNDFANAVQTIIFDNIPFNQDIFITAVDTRGGSNPINYYIELETMALTDIQATQLTLQSIRTLSNP
jgi:hypothetical protein